MNIQLTISLLVSDRMTTLGRCLASLKPLLREIDSELIIVYTGNSPDTLELAQQYTSHIILFTWCNDFSKARNAGLQAAKGEWFLYLDDDEWFEDVNELIYFFKSGEYRQFQSAFYIQRNYLNWEGSSFADAYVGRMCRLLPNTHFVFPIHENIKPYPEPSKKFRTFVHHFGYVGVKNEAGQSEKSDRNLGLLKERLENEPESAHLYAQAAQEYAGTGEYDTAVQYCRKGLKLARNYSEPDSLEMWLLLELPHLISCTGNWKCALEEGAIIIDSPRLLDVGKLNLAAMLVNYCWNLKEYEKGLTYVLLYRKTLESLWEQPEVSMTQNGITYTFSSGEAQAMTVYIKGLFFISEILASADHSSDMDTNITTEKASDADIEKSSVTGMAAIKLMAAGISAADVSFGMIDQILSWIPWDDKSRVVPQYANLEEWKRQYEKQKKAILSGYHKLTADNFYVNLQKAYYAEMQTLIIENDTFYKLWQSCACDCPVAFLPQLIEMAVRNAFPLKILLDNISLEDWNSCIGLLAKHTALPDMDTFYQKILPELADYPLLAERLNQRFLEKQLTQGLLEPSHLLELLGKYCESVISDARMIYRDDLLNTPDSYILPAQYKFAMRIKDVLQLMENDNYGACIPLLTEALHLYPQLSIAVSGLTKHLNEKIKNPPHPVSAEFELLGGQVKQMLHGLIGNGQWEEAYGVNAQLISLLPDDLEILRLKQEILRQGI